MLVHECNALGCHAVVLQGYKYCDKHYREHVAKWSASRDQRHKRIYNKRYNQYERDQDRNHFYHSAEWTNVRDYVKLRDFMTSAVSGKVLTDHDYIVDHVIPLRLCDQSQRLDADNLWLLSRSEHNIKTKLERTMNNEQLKQMNKESWHKLLLSKIKS